MPRPSRRWARFGVPAPLMLALAAIAAGGAQTAVAATLPPYAYTATSACQNWSSAPGATQVIVYASRGSEENDTPDHPDQYRGGLGAELEPIYAEIVKRYRPGDVRLVTNRAPQRTTLSTGGQDPSGPPGTNPAATPTQNAQTSGYPAAGTEYHPDQNPDVSTISGFYAQSVTEGTNAAWRDLSVLRVRCPSRVKLLAIGYSEGAEVTRRALAKLTFTPAAGTAMAMVFGDVLWSPTEPNMSFVGDTDPILKGYIRAVRVGIAGPAAAANVAAIPPFPAAWNVTSYCHRGDLACQFPLGTLQAHLTYGEDDAIGASGRAAQYLGGFANAVTARLSTGAQCYPAGAPLAAVISVAGAPAGAAATVFGRYQQPLWTEQAFAPVTVNVGPGGTGTPVALRPLDPRKDAIVLRLRDPSQSATDQDRGAKLDYRRRC